MSKTYWVWKDPEKARMQGEIEWLQMNKQQFNEFLQLPEALNRFFIDFTDYKIEASEAEFVRWRSEKNHTRYIQKQSKRYTTFSYHGLEENGGCIGEEFAVDEATDVEGDAINTVAIDHLKKVLSQLSDEDQELIYSLYLQKNPLTERDYADKVGLSCGSINKKKTLLLGILKNLLGSKALKKSASR